MNGESMEDEAICSVNTHLIVALNVCEVGGLSKARSLVEVSQIWPDVRVVSDTLLIALKKYK